MAQANCWVTVFINPISSFNLAVSGPKYPLVHVESFVPIMNRKAEKYILK